MNPYGTIQLNNTVAVSVLLCGCTALDGNKMHRENARWELHKNATSYFEQILEATPYETTAVWPLIFYLKNHPNKMNEATAGETRMNS